MTATPIEGATTPSQTVFGANPRLRLSPMSGRASPSGGRVVKPDLTRGHEQKPSAGQIELSRRNSNVSETAGPVSEQTKHETEQATSGLSPPDRGRPNDIITWQTLRGELADVETSDAGANSFISPSGRLLKPSALPLPPRPKPFSSAAVHATDRKPTDNYHGMHPPPNAQAVVSPPQQPCLADYSPWAGNHVEDQMSEQVIRTGYAMKSLVTGETDTAKKAFSSCFKHSSSLQNLSSILTSVLLQRHERGKVSASSTFKPPPRVTLTDTKREVWLNELADLRIPLRKLSRTIPHGIRGRVLLEQCVTKLVPIPRAIWLAKCVGANELRAFRRKGVAGPVILDNEQKWVREWTIVVETFLDDCSISAHPDWKNRISYALRLTAQLFAEQLLDRDHFLDWSLDRLEATNNDMLPLTILKVYMTLSSFTSSLKHGRRLATLCLAKLHELLQSPDVDLLLPLVDRIKVLLRNMAIQHPDCMVIRQNWNLYRNTLLCLHQDVAQTSGTAVDEVDGYAMLDEAFALQRVVDHNDQISRAICKDTPLKEFPHLSLITQLDKLEPWQQVDHVAHQLLLINPDLPNLVSIVVQWATSLYRENIHGIYFASRLLRHYRNLGYDTDESILSSWDDCTKHTVVCPKKLGKLIAELTRAGDFNATRFLRWLIAGGGVTEQENPCGVQVLVDLPVSSEHPGIAGLQRMLLQANPSHESARIESSSVKQMLLDEAAAAFRSADEENAGSFPTNWSPTILSCSDIFEISDFIRQLVSLHFEGRKIDPNLQVAGDSSPQTAKLTTGALQKIINIFGLTGDAFGLAELLSVALESADSDSLALICNTLELHFECVSAVGASEALCQKICDRYRILRKTRSSKELVLSLIAICGRLPSFEPLLPRLKKELSSCDSSVGIAAHTPMSDIQIESTGGGDGELEPSLTVGPDADSNQIKYVFETLLSRGLKQFDDDQTARQLANILSNLKIQHEAAFQDVVTSWIREQFVLGPADNLQRDALNFLIGSGCVDVEAFAASVDQACEGLLAEKPQAAFTASLKTLKMFCLETNSVTGYPITRALVALRRFSRDHPKALLPFLRRCLEASNPGITLSQMQPLLQNGELLAILRRLMLDEPDSVLALFENQTDNSSSEAEGPAKQLMVSLVDPSTDLHVATSSDVNAVRLVLETADGLSLSSHQLFLRYVTSKASLSQDDRTALAKTCVEAMVVAQMRGYLLWQRLVTSIDNRVARQICTLAENHLLADSPKQDGSDHEITADEKPDPRYWSAIVEATAFSLPDEGDIQIGRSIESQLSAAASLMAGSFEPQSEATQQWLQAMCLFAMIRGTSCTAAGNSSNVVQILCSLLARDVGQWTAQTLRAIFDVAAHMVEDLSPQVFITTRNNLGSLSRHQSIRFLFGIAENADAWLYAMRISQAQGPQLQPAAQNQEQNSQQPFPLRRWELLPDLSQNTGTNDTALSMRFFDASKVA